MTIEPAIPASPLSGSTSAPQRPPSGETFESVLLAALDAQSSGESAGAALDSDALPVARATPGVAAHADAAQAAAGTASQALNSIASMESSLGFGVSQPVLDELAQPLGPQAPAMAENGGTAHGGGAARALGKEVAKGSVPSLPVINEVGEGLGVARAAVAASGASNAPLSSDGDSTAAQVVRQEVAKEPSADLIVPVPTAASLSVVAPAAESGIPAVQAVRSVYVQAQFNQQAEGLTSTVLPSEVPKPSVLAPATPPTPPTPAPGLSAPPLSHHLPQVATAGMQSIVSSSLPSADHSASASSAPSATSATGTALEVAPQAQPTSDSAGLGPPSAAQGTPAPHLAAAHLLTAGTPVPAPQAPAAIAQVSSSPGQIRIALSPEGLGSVLVQVTATADGVSVTVRASSEALNAIGRHAVVEALNSAGVNASRVEFVSTGTPQPSPASSDENNSGSDSGDRSQREPGTASSFEDSESEPFVFELPDTEEQL